MNTKFFKTLKKCSGHNFLSIFVCFDNLLIINMLYLNSPFPPSNHPKTPFTFKLLFRHTFQTVNYTLLNI